MIRVMIVDDSATMRAFLSSVLSEAPDLEVIAQAQSGVEAVAMVTEHKPDLITMDLMMPEMDGVTAIRRIMEIRPTPILVISGYTETMDLGEVFESMKAGALDVIAKPKDAEDWTSGEWTGSLVERVRTLASTTLKSGS